MKARIQVEAVLGKDLLPGDLFSSGGPGYWDTAMDKGSVGEKVYIRTNAPCPESQENEPIFRITIELSD